MGVKMIKNVLVISYVWFNLVENAHTIAIHDMHQAIEFNATVRNWDFTDILIIADNPPK